jgi:hypothetical protein
MWLVMFKWGLTPYSLVRFRPSGGTHRLRLPPGLSPTFTDFLLDLLFDLKNGGDVPPKRRALQTTPRYNPGDRTLHSHRSENPKLTSQYEGNSESNRW